MISEEKKKYIKDSWKEKPEIFWECWNPDLANLRILLSEKLQDADDVEDESEGRAYKKEDSKEHEDLASRRKRLDFGISSRREVHLHFLSDVIEMGSGRVESCDVKERERCLGA